MFFIVAHLGDDEVDGGEGGEHLLHVGLGVNDVT